jgi:hypothetical protein
LSGTTGAVAKFTASNAVGDSIMTESGAVITVTSTLNATAALQIGGASINTAGTLANVAYLNAANNFTNASGQTFAGGIGLSGGSPSTHGINIPSAVPGILTTNLHNAGGLLIWTGGATFPGNVTVTTMNTYTFDQSVASGASPTFTGTNITGIPDGGNGFTADASAAYLVVAGSGILSASASGVSIGGDLTLAQSAAGNRSLTGDRTDAEVTVRGGSTGAAIQFFGSTYTNYAGAMYLDTTTDLGGTNDGDFIFRPQGVEKMRLNSAGLLTVSGFGTHSFSAGGTGANIIAVSNTTAGTGNDAQLRVGNDSAVDFTVLGSTSSTYTIYASTIVAAPSPSPSGPVRRRRLHKTLSRKNQVGLRLMQRRHRLYPTAPFRCGLHPFILAPPTMEAALRVGSTP